MTNISAGDMIAGLALIISIVTGILNFFYTRSVNNSAKKKELNDILAELHMVRNEYIRFDRGGGNPATEEYRFEHMRIISRAQYLIRRAAWYKEINDGLSVAYEKAKIHINRESIDSDLLHSISDRGKYSLPFIAQTRLTVNQTRKADATKLDHSSVIDLQIFDDYSWRNERALDDAIEAIGMLLYGKKQITLKIKQGRR